MKYIPSRIPSIAVNISLASAFMFISCGESRVAGNYGDYEQENVTVIGGDTGTQNGGEERITVSTTTGEGECIEVSSTLCVPSDTGGAWCEREGGPADIIVVDGVVVEVICYPPANDDDRPVEQVDGNSTGDIDIVQSANRTTVVFNDDTNGVPIEGDLSIAGNNVAIYGNGIDETIIDGDVVLDGNNVRLRGMTIRGNLTIAKNKAAVVLCRIMGDVILQGVSTNGTIFAENDVFGGMHSTSNNNTIIGNDTQGAWDISGANNACDANHAFTDADENSRVDDAERAALLTCP